MTHEVIPEEQVTHNGRGFHLGRFLSGMLLGGMVGATTALLVAPQSGADTRAMIRDRSLHLRGRVEAAAEEARMRGEELQRKGHQYVEGQKTRVQRTSRAAKEAWKEQGAATPGAI